MPRYDYWEAEHGFRLTTLMQHTLFQDCLLDDIREGNVFPAIRGRKIDFYMKGRKLFSFNGMAFQANVAYLAAFQNRPKGEITEEVFSQSKVCNTFKDGYSQIKAHLALYEQPESGGVFKLCKAFSCFAKTFAGPIGVFDIELSLEATDEDRSQDRLDLILFHLVERRLRFFEVKTFANKEIWPTNGNVAVVDQIARYEEQLIQREQEVIDGYQQYVRLMNRLCGVNLPEPTYVDREPDLLLIDYDSNQYQTIQNVLLPAFDGAFRCCSIGDPKRAKPSTLASWWNNR